MQSERDFAFKASSRLAAILKQRVCGNQLNEYDKNNDCGWSQKSFIHKGTYYFK